MKRPTLGVVAICFNEEEDLPRFLEHLLPWIDEIVLVDDGSTDRTRQIALDAGSKVKFLQLRRKQDEYFSHQRNKGIEAAESEWLLHMDIDERVTPKLRDEIVEAISSPNKDAFRFRRLNYFLHRPMRGGGWQDWNQVHLAKRSLFHFGGMSHETCHVDTQPDRIGQLSEKMHHLNDASFPERIRKSAQYVVESATKIRNDGTQVGGMTLIYRTVREFIYRYFYRFGFRDGIPGVVAAFHSATATFRAYAIIWDEQHHIARDAIEATLAKLDSEETDVLS